MGQVARVMTGSGSIEDQIDALRQQMNEVLLVVDDHVEFGEPGNPQDPEYALGLRAGDMSAAGMHNGTLSNVNGSWVEIELTSAGITDAVCTHNLFSDTSYSVPVAGEPNCRWIHFALMHDGQAGDGTSLYTVDVSFIGGTVAAEAITLRMNLVLAGTAITVDADHPVLVTLFFTKATRGE